MAKKQDFYANVTSPNGKIKVYVGQAYKVGVGDLPSVVKVPKLVPSNPYTLQNEDANFILHSDFDVPNTIIVPNGLTDFNRFEGKQIGSRRVSFEGNLEPSENKGFATYEQTSVWAIDNIGNNRNILFGELADKADVPGDWQDIAKYFKPPLLYQNNYGNYPDPLIFYDGVRTVQNANDLEDRKQEIRDKWMGIMGEWLSVNETQELTFISSEQKTGYVKHTVTFEHVQGEVRQAYLLVPDVSGIKPAVVTVYYDPETALGEGLEHRDFAKQLVLEGFTALSIGVSDGNEILYSPSKANTDIQPLSMMANVAANAYEVLAKVADVDASRIGIIGHSYGGKWAMFGSCLYEKYALGVWSDGGIVFDEVRGVNYWTSDYLGATTLPAVAPVAPPFTGSNPRTGAYAEFMSQGMNTTELHALMCPRPFLVSGGDTDKANRWMPLNHAIAVNNVLGVKNRVAMTNRNVHAPSPDSNKQMRQFFRHFLK